jgi:hypothetical protein
MSNLFGYVKYHNLDVHKTGLSIDQIKSLRDPVIRSIDFIEKHKIQIGQDDYKNLFQQYQHILNLYNNMIDTNLIQSKYIDPRTVVQTQPIIDGKADYDVADWEKQFTVNNLNIDPYTIPPINAFRDIKDYGKFSTKYQTQY